MQPGSVIGVVPQHAVLAACVAQLLRACRQQDETAHQQSVD